MSKHSPVGLSLDSITAAINGCREAHACIQGDPRAEAEHIEMMCVVGAIDGVVRFWMKNPEQAPEALIAALKP